MEEQKTISPFESEQEAQESKTEQSQQLIQPNVEIVSQVENLTQIAEQVEYAGFWVRFAAMLIDGLILLVPSIIVSMIFGKNQGFILQYVLMWAYAIYMLSTKQATFGKMAVGLKVTTVDGQAVSVEKLALREIIGKTVLNSLTLGVGYIMIAFTEKKQGLHDMISNTVVTYDPARKRRPWITVVAVLAFLMIPIGILAGVVLVSTNSARNKSLESKAKQEKIMKDAQTQNRNR